MTEFSTIIFISQKMMAYFLIFAAAASAVASPPSAELRKLPVSELRAMLDARGVECKACVEKKHWVARVRKTWKRPIVKKAGGNGARRKRRKTKPKGAAERRTAGLEVQDDGHGGYTLPKETFMEQLGANPDMDRGMMEQLWEQFSAQLESGTISLDPAKNKGVKQTIDMQGRGKKKKRSRSRKGKAAGGGGGGRRVELARVPPPLLTRGRLSLPLRALHLDRARALPHRLPRVCLERLPTLQARRTAALLVSYC